MAFTPNLLRKRYMTGPQVAAMSDPPESSHSFIVRIEHSLPPKGNHSSIKVHDEPLTSVPLPSNLHYCTSQPFPLPALRQTSSIPSQFVGPCNDRNHYKQSRSGMAILNVGNDKLISESMCSLKLPLPRTP